MKRKRFEISNNISNICNNSNKEIHLPEKIRPHLSGDIPEDFLCPISLEIMKDPVIAADGHTYDRENITKWLSQKRRRSILCSPLDGSKLDNINLQQNIFARKIIDSFLTMDAFKINNTKGLPRFEEISIMPDNLDDFNTKLFNHELQLKKQISTLEELYRKSMNEIKEKENTINLLTKGNLSLKNKIESNAQLKKEITQLEIRNNKLKEVLNNRENHNDIINKENIFLKNEIERITLINEDIIQNQKSNNQKLINEQTDLIAIKKDNIFFDRCLLADNGNFKNRILGDKGAQSIAESLKINTKLKVITLVNNMIADEGVRAIAESLKINTKLEWINLSKNHIGDLGVRSIAESLKINITLNEIDLGFNKIGSEGARSIAELIKENTTLKVIRLSGNNIRDKGAVCIADGLKINTTLTVIYLGHCHIGDEGVKAIAESLEINTTLKKIFLAENPIGYEIKNNLRKDKRVLL